MLLPFSSGWFRSLTQAFMRAHLREAARRRHRHSPIPHHHSRIGRKLDMEALELRVMLATTLTGAIDETGEQDFYTFNVAQDARYYFDSLTNDSQLRWNLDGPSGNIVSNRSFNNSDGVDIGNPVLELPAGNYTLTIDGIGDTTNAPYSFRIYNLKSAINITPGNQVSGTLQPRETDAYKFVVANAGDTFNFDSVSITGATNADWRLIDPYDNVYFNAPVSNDQNNVTLTQPGTYTLLLESRFNETQATNYTFNVVPNGNVPQPPPSGTPLTIGSVTNGNIAVAGEVDNFTFNLATAQRLDFDSLTNSTTLRWGLVGPSGTIVSNRPFNSSDSNDINSPTLFLPAGAYQLSVSASSGTGAYSFNLFNLNSATSYTPGNVQSGTLNPGISTQAFKFNANAGNKVYFDVQDALSTGTYRLLDAYGQQIFNTNGDVDTFTLTQTGTYTLLVEGRFNAGATQTFSFDIQPVTISTTPMTIGSTVNGSIAVQGESDQFTFTVATPTDVVFDSLTNTNVVRWSLDGPAGNYINLRNFNSSDSNDFGSPPAIHLAPGNYTITIDGSTDTTGASYSFRLLDIATAAPYTPGTLLNGTLNPGISTQLFKFNANAGDKFYFDVQTALGSGIFRLLDPFLQQVMFSGGDVDTFSVGASGTYTLLVEGRFNASPTQPFIVDLQPVTIASTPMTIGATVNGSISVQGESDVYTFNVASTTNVVFDSLTNTNVVRWSLDGPAGNYVSVRNFNSSDSNDFGSNPVLTLTPGTYTLTIDGSTDTAGAPYSFRLLDLSTATSFTPGNVVSGTLNPGIQTQLFKFNATAGDKLYFDVQTALGNGIFRILDPFNQQILFSGGDVETFTVNATGTYTLLVEGRFNASPTQPFAFDLQPVTFSSTPMSLNTTINGSIALAGERDDYTFTLASPARLYFDSLTSLGTVNWTLVGPRGTEVSNRGFSSSDSNDFGSNPVLKLPAGSYTLTVDGSTDTAATNYSFRLLDLATAGTSFTTGNVQNSALNPGNVTDVYRFTANAGDIFNFDAQNSIANGAWRLIDTFGNQQFFSSFADVNAVQVTQTGTYTLLIEGRSFQVAGQPYIFNVAFQSNSPILPFTGTAYTIGSTVSDSISVSGEHDDYVFTLASNARLYFDALSNSPNIRWTLTGPAGVEVSNRGFQSSDAVDVTNPVLDLVAGQYKLVVDASGTNTGAYSFRIADLATATPITPGTPVSGTLNPALTSNFYSFNGTAGQKMFFDTQARSGGANNYWRLIDPYNNVVFIQANGSANSDIDTFALPSTGQYLLLWEARFNDTVVSTFTFNVQPVVDGGPTPITVGSTVNGQIDETGEQDVYTFNLASNTRLYFDSLTGNNGNLRWSLVGPRGVEVSNRGVNSSDSVDISNPVLNLPAGSYTLTFDALGDTTLAPYSFRLLDFSAATPMTVGTPVSSSINALETKMYKFNASAGDTLFFDTQARSGLSNMYWRLIDAFDNVVFIQANGSANSDIDTFALPTSGTYTLLWESRFNDTGSGSYTFNVQPVANGGPTPITLGSIVNGQIDETGEQDVYTFTLASATRLYFDQLNNNSNLRWSLSGPRGAEITNRGWNNSDAVDIGNPVIDLPAGNYTLTVDATGDTQLAPYSFRLLDFSAATPITPGTPVSGTLNPANETDLYKFTANAGDLFFFDTQAKSGAPNSYWRLIDQFGNVLFITSQSSSNSDIDTFALPTSGTFTLLIEGRFNDQGAQAGNYTFNVQPVINGAPIEIVSNPHINIADNSVTEGTGGTNNLVFTVTLDDTTDVPVVINYSTANGTAIAGSDYTATSGQLTIQPGDLTGTISVPITTDSTQETSETFLLNLNNATGGTINDGQATGTIIDDDAPLNNLPPVNSVPAAQNINEDSSRVFSVGNSNLISISDPDAGGANVQVALTAASGTITLSGITGLVFSAGDGTADATMTFTGTIAAINTALAGLSFTPTANFNGAASLTITTNDLGNTGAGGPQSDTDSVTINVAGVNDPPVNNVPGTQNTNEDTPLTFNSANSNLISITDIDAASGALQVTVSVTNGTLTLSGTTGLSFSNGDGTADPAMTFTGTLSAINAALNGMVFTPPTDVPGSALFSITTNDQGNTGTGGAQSDTDGFTINIAAVNDAPVNNVPGTQSTNEGTTLVFNAGNSNLISISDVDAGSGTMKVTLASTNGTMTLSGVAGLSFTGGDGTADASMTFTGTISAINTALNGMSFTPTALFNGAASISITTDDQGNTGAGGAKTDTDAVTINVGSTNDAPVNTIPATALTNEDTALTFSGNVSVADPDAGSASIQLALTVTNGTLSLAGTTGLGFSVGDGTADSTMTFTGTITAINAALNGLVYTPTANFNGGATLTMTSNDLGNSGSGGAKTDTDSCSITVNAVNDAPVNVVPGAQSTPQDTAKVFSGGAGNLIAISDVDAGNSPMQVALAATNGTLTLATVAGLSFSVGDGAADASMTFTGTIASINAALNGMSFAPTAGFTGAAGLSITTSDQGNTGTGGALSDSDSVNITVTSVAQNQPPVNTVPGAQQVDQAGTLTFSSGNSSLISIADPDAGSSSVQVALTAANGVITLAQLTGLSFVTGDGTADASMTFTGTIASINNALAGMTYKPDAAFRGATSLTITTNDLGHTGAGGALSDTDSVNITVNNVTPIANAGPDKQGQVNTSITLNGTFTDPGIDTHTFLWSVVASNGQIIPDGTSQDFTFTPNAPGTYTITFKVTDGADAFGTDTAIVTVPEKAASSIDSFTLMDSTTDLPIFTITEGMTINLATLPHRTLNVRANTTPTLLGSVKYGFDKISGQFNSSFAVENILYYSLFGDEPTGNFRDGSLSVGAHTITATPFSGHGATGTAGNGLTIHFNVIDQGRQSVTSLTLIDADTDKELFPLVDGAVLNLGTLPKHKLNVRAFTSPSIVGSVRFNLDNGKLIHNENIEPYALFGNTGLDFDGGMFSVGSHVLTVTPFSGTNASGTAGGSLTIHFTVVSAGPGIASLTLVDADTDKDLFQLTNGSTINRAALSQHHLNVRANTSPSKVGSVLFDLDNGALTHFENTVPYALFGNSLNDYFGGSFTTGAHKLKVTAFTGANGSGTAGQPTIINFVVV